MKQLVNLIFIGVAFLMLGGCGEGHSVRQLPHLGDTPYQQDTILMAYAVNPERALRLLDSARMLGKINALNDLGRYEEVILLAQRILDRLDHYEQHARDYAEDSYRLSWSDRPADRDRYLDFSRAQAWGFMAQAYAVMSKEGKQTAADEARKYLTRFDQSNYGKTFMARRMIAPAQMALGMYDEALATYDEVERRMGTDTLNTDYATILHSRAIASRSRGLMADAFDYQTRYANGLTFPQFINTIRLEEAKQMLDTQADTTLIAIAEAVGFTPANLREQFKRCYGMTSQNTERSAKRCKMKHAFGAATKCVLRFSTHFRDFS